MNKLIRALLALLAFTAAAPSPVTARVQEAHKILYHSICEWVEARV